MLRISSLVCADRAQQSVYSASSVQEECVLTPPQSILDLLQKVKHLHSTLPFRSKHKLAQQVYEKQLVPLPAPAPEPAPIQVSGPVSAAPALAPKAERDPRTPPDDHDSVNVAYVVGPIAAAALLVLVVVVVAVLVRRQRAKRRLHGGNTSGSRVYSKVCKIIDTASAANAFLFCCPAMNDSGVKQEPINNKTINEEARNDVQNDQCLWMMRM
jgi:hypothetical protein